MSAAMKDQFRCFKPFNLNDAQYVCQNASVMEQSTARILGHLPQYDAGYSLRELMDLDASWCMYSPDGLPFMAGGFRFLTLTNVITITASTNEWRANVKNVTRDCRAVIETMMENTPVRRIECRSLGENTPAHRWYETLGFHKEATLEQYGPLGESVCVHAITMEKKQCA